MRNKLHVCILKQVTVSPRSYDEKYLYAFQNLLIHIHKESFYY